MTEHMVDTINQPTEGYQVKDTHFTRFVRDLTANLKEKQQKVLMKRFGLSGRKRATLESIGKEFGVTRERVRQIEASSLAKLSKMAVLDHNKPMFEKAQALLATRGGAADEDTFVEAFILDLEDSRRDELKRLLRFSFLLWDEIESIIEGEHTKAGWRLSSHDHGMIEELAEAYTTILDTHGDVLADEELIAKIAEHSVTSKYSDILDNQLLLSVIDISRKIHKHEGGKRGLATWPWVKPRTIRDKIFYVLSRNKQPMHFAAIAQAIEASSFDTKKVTVQTVHNELISDIRFILVGRGLYGLNSWGFEGGTVEEVIEKILKKSAPLDKQAVLDEVLKKKQVKKATILINLQGSKKFKKTAKGYVLAVKS